ncbi:Cullin binding-domain-containing protein [Spinellus fusiger]|nr:Cullin binding-domain-containing protein [Spinellus fusiger]
MPPKRKLKDAETAKEQGSKGKASTIKKPRVSSKKPATRQTDLLNKLKKSSVEEIGFNPTKAEAWFNQYKDEDDPEMITPQGSQQFFNDLDVPLESRLLPEYQKQMEFEEVFKKVYLFCFGYSKTSGQKSMDVDMAIALWQLMFQDTYPHVPEFIEYLQKECPVKVINKDQWSSLFEFVRNVPKDLVSYDDTSSYYPTHSHK